MKTDQIEKELPQVIRTKLKFVRSQQTGMLVAFVSQNSTNGRICGVRQDSELAKKVCILEKSISRDILPNVLYDVVMRPMTRKNGYIVIEANPIQFQATIETTYVPKALYIVDVKFGNKVIRFDPKDGKKDTVKTLSECKRVLERRVDIQDILQVVEDFMLAASDILRRYSQDGFYTKRSTNKKTNRRNRH